MLLEHKFLKITEDDIENHPIKCKDQKSEEHNLVKMKSSK